MPMDTQQATTSGANSIYNYNQVNNSYFQDLTWEFDKLDALRGLCLGICMSWLLYRSSLKMGAKDEFFSNISEHTIKDHCLRIIPSKNWIEECDKVMKGMGFTAWHGAPGVFASSDLATHLGITQDWVSDAPEKQYCILVAYNGKHSHAMGLHLRNMGVAFFDPNEGYAFFPIRSKFVSWFKDHYMGSALPGLPYLLLLHYSKS